MKQYLLSVYQPDGDPPPAEVLDPIMRQLAALHDELKAAGGYVLHAGLHPASTATVLRARDGEVIMTDGPFTEGKEHLGGFLLLRAPDLDAALAWGRRFTEVTTLPIEVRPVQEGDQG